MPNGHVPRKLRNLCADARKPDTIVIWLFFHGLNCVSRIVTI